MSCSSDVDERTLREIYLPAFETAVKKAHLHPKILGFCQTSCEMNGDSKAM